jgi:CubicO group peptidase (beta-lactamase class C family)
MPELQTVLRKALDRAVLGGVFPGAVAEVWQHGEELAFAASGRTRLDGIDERAVDRETVYDIASLTKVFVSTLTWRLVAAGRLSLDEPVEKTVPVPSAAITLADLLRHTSGLPAWRPFFETVPHDRRAIVRAAAAEPLEREPGRDACYSDLGFILLAEVLERRTSRGLADLLSGEVLAELGLEATRYLLVESGPVPEVEGRPVAATELCPWRRRVLCGEVHDDNCFAMGGVSGHAGLFSTAREVARLGAALLEARTRGGLLPVHAALLATSPSVGGRTLGLDVPSGPVSAAGTLLARTSFGHLGFTGCSLWCDPERDLVVVLLSNRVHPTRQNELIRQLRPELHDAIVRAVDDPDSP